MLTLRLSEEEYQLLREASLSGGARSVSDYARDSLFRAASNTRAPGADTLKCRLDQAETEIRSLQRDLQNLQLTAGQALNR